jgi:hypothetical protein
MESIIEKQEEIITQLQLAIEHYLEKGDLETALVYSELFKLNCEAYKSLVCNKEAKEEKHCNFYYSLLGIETLGRP